MADGYRVPEQYRGIEPMSQRGSQFLQSYYGDVGWPEMATRIGAVRSGESKDRPRASEFPLYGDDPQKDLFLMYLLEQYMNQQSRPAPPQGSGDPLVDEAGRLSGRG